MRYQKSIIHFIKGIKAQKTVVASGGIREQYQRPRTVGKDGGLEFVEPTKRCNQFSQMDNHGHLKDFRVSDMPNRNEYGTKLAVGLKSRQWTADRGFLPWDFLSLERLKVIFVTGGRNWGQVAEC